MVDPMHNHARTMIWFLPSTGVMARPEETSLSYRRSAAVVDPGRLTYE